MCGGGGWGGRAACFVLIVFFCLFVFIKVSEIINQVHRGNVLNLVQNSEIVVCHKNKVYCPSQSNEDSKWWGIDDKLLCELAKPVIAEATL